MLKLPPKGQPAPGVFWRPNSDFADELARELTGCKVLEIFAGNGYLAALLRERGIDILATSLRSSHDAHSLGLYHPVEDIEACQAVEAHGATRDILLMCWPTTTPAALRACELWGTKPIAYIGEATDYSKGHLGGCATDEFFERFAPSKILSSYKGNMLEIAALGRLGPAPAPARSQARGPL
jgi:hypothetical protein